MSNPNAMLIEPENNKDSLSLADRLDPAIGETTSMVGAMLTELLRRTLRGGVVRIGEEMHGYVSEKVDTVIAERKPALEQIAADVAEHTARTAATEVATEEVHALERRTQESDRELATQIETTARTAQEKTAETAQTLAAQIQEAERRAEAALREQVQALVERSREGSGRLKAKLTELEETAAALGKLHETLRQDLLRHMENGQIKLRDELRDVLKANAALSARVEELERPRGLRALFARLFRRRKSTGTQSVAIGAANEGLDA